MHKSLDCHLQEEQVKTAHVSLGLVSLSHCRGESSIGEFSSCPLLDLETAGQENRGLLKMRAVEKFMCVSNYLLELTNPKRLYCKRPILGNTQEHKEKRKQSRINIIKEMNWSVLKGHSLMWFWGWAPVLLHAKHTKSWTSMQRDSPVSYLFDSRDKNFQ